MTERDLENLKTLPVPPAHDAKRRAAMTAALQAYEAGTAVVTMAGGARDEAASAPIENPTKENVVPLRQTETSRSKRSFRMMFSSRQGQALAASFVALAIAAPIAFQQIKPPLQQTYQTVQSHLVGNKPGGSATAPPPVLQSQLKKDENAVSVTPPLTVDIKKLAEIGVPSSNAGGQLGLAGGTAAPQPTIRKEDTEKAKQYYSRDLERRRANLNAPGDGQLVERDSARPAASAAGDNRPNSWMGDAEDRRTIVIEQNRDKFDAKEINPVKQAALEPVSTFSIDADTASYAFMRRALNSGHLPPKDAVRVEEMINYFPYNYSSPESADVPFKPTVTVMPSPWNANNKLVHVAIKGYDLKSAERPRANLVLLMDVSGSMASEDRLPLVKNAFRLLVDQLKPDDTIGIVTYASGSGIALEPTPVAQKQKILAAIDQLGAGGSTAGADGIQDAYRLAEAGFQKNAVNRIILATDGDFNVGPTDQNELKGLIERKRQSGIFLSIIGVGQGNHNDALMQTLAQNGNGVAAYADTLSEARKVLVDESSSTLFTIAKDVKVQIEWNPARVAEYRLIGYETRNLKREDFNNDRVDAGDIGSGHAVTAIYEVTPVGAPKTADDLRYGKATAAQPSAKRVSDDLAQASEAIAAELGQLKLRYKRPNEDQSQLVSLIINDGLEKTLNETPGDARFSVAVAAFGQLLKGEPYLQSYTFDDVLSLAQSARGEDPFGYRAEFLNLVRLAKSARP